MLEQGAGSLTAHLAGALYVQLGQNSIQFVSGSRVFALDSGSWQPLPDGSAGSAPANYGGAAGDYFTSGVAAARKIEVDITSGAVAVQQGSFDVSPPGSSVGQRLRTVHAHGHDAMHSFAIAHDHQSSIQSSWLSRHIPF